MSVERQISCIGFPSDFTTSSNSLSQCHNEANENTNGIEKQPQSSSSNFITSSSSTTSASLTSGVYNSECRLYKVERKGPPNIDYETNIAKTILKEYSTLSGDNLFDHLADLIKRVVEEKPPNVIDFFEEFSRNVREQKFHMPERFPPDSIYEKPRMYSMAKRILFSMKLPYPRDNQDQELDEHELKKSKSKLIDDLKLKNMFGPMKVFKFFNERVLQLQFYWNQCGFSISSEDMFQLTSSMNRLQTHPSIMQCRFWGVINGLKSAYYIVEACLTREEVSSRLAQMEEELIEKHRKQFEHMCLDPKPMPMYVGPELIPGMQGWEKYPPEELAKMKPEADPIPLVEQMDVFDVPPEMIGTGLNRYSYFVVNNLYDDWIELPIVTPKQIITSRNIKKFLTGDLEAEIKSYPCFPGKEKHYLRAMIARITAGTIVAPRGYYRRMTKTESRMYDGLVSDEMEEEEEEEGLMEEDEEIDNDITLLRDRSYKYQEENILLALNSWVHVRPYILNQGRVVWFDLEKARKDRDKELERLMCLRMAEEEEDELNEEDVDDDEEGEEEETIADLSKREIGPPILSSLDQDYSSQYIPPWSFRHTSNYTNINERVLVLHSNVWQGAYTFIYANVCESIYMGWGHKYNSRNMAYTHLKEIDEEYPHTTEDFMEATDPSVEEEEAYRQALLDRMKLPKEDDTLIDVEDNNGDQFDESDDAKEEIVNSYLLS